MAKTERELTVVDRCDCPPLGMSACPHCGRFRDQAHRDRCHKAAVGNLNVTPAGSSKPASEED